MADLAVCARIGGGKWDSSLGAWTFPVTEKYTRLLQEQLHIPLGAPQAEVLQPDVPTCAAVLPGCACAPDSQLLSVAVPEAGPVVPAGLLFRPWRHQSAAFKFCMERFAAGMRGILLAMSMGTGKTNVAWMIVLALAALRIIIVCPLRVVQVWVTEAARHVGIPLVIAALDDEIGSVARKRALAEEKLRLAESRGQPFVCIINYDSAWRTPFAEWARKIRWDIAIADEAHKVKAPTGRASKFCALLSQCAAYRLALTGTPMPHNHTDIFAILRFTDASILGQYWGPFKREYCQMGGFQNKQIIGPRNLQQLERKVARVMYRVGPEVLDLPPETHVTYHCELSPEGRRVYRSLDEHFVAGVKDGTITVSNAMTKVRCLAQLTGGWLHTDDGEPYHVDDSKQKVLEDVLDDIADPAVVFCWFHQDLDTVHDACRRLQYNSLELSGRRDELKRWQEGDAPVLAVQIRSGGVGVNFTRARYSIFYSLGFSLADYEQAKKRVHRPGQTRPVEHIHLVAKGTVDERIMRALEKRAEVIEAILAEIAAS